MVAELAELSRSNGHTEHIAEHGLPAYGEGITQPQDGQRSPISIGPGDRLVKAEKRGITLIK
jgi:hypothetical protein